LGDVGFAHGMTGSGEDPLAWLEVSLKEIERPDCVGNAELASVAKVG